MNKVVPRLVPGRGDGGADSLIYPCPSGETGAYRDDVQGSDGGPWPVGCRGVCCQGPRQVGIKVVGDGEGYRGRDGLVIQGAVGGPGEGWAPCGSACCGPAVLFFLPRCPSSRQFGSDFTADAFGVVPGGGLDQFADGGHEFSGGLGDGRDRLVGWDSGHRGHRIGPVRTGQEVVV